MKDRTWARILLVILGLSIIFGGWNTFVAHNTESLLAQERNKPRTINITEIVYNATIIDVCPIQLFPHPTCRQTLDEYSRYTLVSKECYYKDSAYIQRRIYETHQTLIDDLEFQSILDGLNYWIVRDPLYSDGGFKIAYMENSVQRVGAEPVITFKQGTKPKWMLSINYTIPNT